MTVRALDEAAWFAEKGHEIRLTNDEQKRASYTGAVSLL